ncbi:MAG: DUF1598 domain-containing protein [Planctomycetaceae bacterium]
MSRIRTALACHFAASLVLAILSELPPVYAQDDGGGDQAGITIDAEGVVQSVIKKGRSETLDKRRMAAVAKEKLSNELNASSTLRKVSLLGLEAAYEPYAGKSESIPPEIFHVAGLQRIDYVFVYPESNDVVIAGPAEGFAPNSIGRMVGVGTGRPPLRLDDLVFAMRAGRGGTRVFCSIDALPENMTALRQYLAENSFGASASVASARYNKMAQVLGMQNVRVGGVPADSHFARVFVEADYRMKLISMALEPAPVRGFRTHLSMLKPEGNSIQRWWLAPLYDDFVATEDGNAYELAGQRVQMMAQEEIADQGGNRRKAASTRLSTREYAKHFTDKFPEIADNSPVFAELQNLFDLLIVAALLQKESIPKKVGWEMGVFLDESRTAFPRGHVPRQVPTVANARRANRNVILGLVGGGVGITPRQVLESTEIKVDTERRLAGDRDNAARAGAGADASKRQQWWWD